MDIGDKIKHLRLRYGLTLEDVGNAVGVGKSTVRKWEVGDISNMRRDKIAKLAEALHTTPAYLMGWEDSPSPSSSSTKNDSEEMAENTVSFIGRNGERIVKTYTPEQMETIRRLLDAIPSEDSDL